ncbi:isoprenylcysteine carboxyl methyltransferase family protein [Ornithinibacillus halophilus]|uniref:Methyltransferase n=1 Tax=Ornithinibacillus halophilus TaxID=930117 RepID=A0A1M5CLM6_9BACI|nr:isoprenylcysteine carboxylmethyltransferase family protein [Ornithinibacillus halophilus]SHF55497.1 methyltransferase [Ornithinibacillus halophilus]
MTTWMWILVSVIIIQRLVELVIAKSNEKWMKARGGIEKGEEHYKLFILLHILFICSILLEVSVQEQGTAAHSLDYFLFSIFIAVQLGRLWCIYSLGRFWNTKIIVLPRVALIKKGPYKYVKHPNYIIVAIELFIIPALFGSYLTAFVFPILHLLLLRVRIPKEEKALTRATLQ